MNLLNQLVQRQAQVYTFGSQPDYTKVKVPDQKIHLPDVELVIVDCVDLNRAQKSFYHCQQWINFGKATILTHFDGPNTTKIHKIKSISEYNTFMLRDLASYLTLNHVLVAQWDGFVWNPGLWDEVFTQYDYIGAPWPENVVMPGIPKHFNVGNGGFSIRSRRLHKWLQNNYNDLIQIPHSHYPNEDVVICQLNRKWIESSGMVFAPYKVAQKFSWECEAYHGHTFGVHARIKLQ